MASKPQWFPVPDDTWSALTAERETTGGDDPRISARLRIRRWWEKELRGQKRVFVPELAHAAFDHFANDPLFVETFWQNFGYEVLYDAAIDLLSSWRIVHDGEGGVVETAQDWFEGRNGSGHVALTAMTPEEFENAIKEREDDIALAQARVDALRKIAAGETVFGVRGRVWNVRVDEKPPKIEVVMAGVDGLPVDAPQPEVADEASDEGPAACHHCNAVLQGEWWGFCETCTDRYGPALLKATVDPFDYALRLYTGELIHFERAAFHGSWVHLTLHDGGNPHVDAVKGREHPPFERGVDVRVSAITWCADAPYGS